MKARVCCCSRRQTLVLLLNSVKKWKIFLEKFGAYSQNYYFCSVLLK